MLKAYAPRSPCEALFIAGGPKESLFQKEQFRLNPRRRHSASAPSDRSSYRTQLLLRCVESVWTLLIFSTLAILRELLFPRHGKRLPGCRHVHEHFAVFGRFGPETLLVMLESLGATSAAQRLRRYFSLAAQ